MKDLTQEERIDRFWDAVDAAEEEFAVMLGVYIDAEGNGVPEAMALEHIAEEIGVH